MIFDSQAPESQYFRTPNYVTDPKTKATLAALGYRPDGSENMFGKVFSFINPAYGIGGQKIAQSIAENAGYSDTMQNIADSQKSRMDKAMLLGNVAIGAAGVATGNAGLAAQGLQGAIESGTSLISNPSKPNYEEWNKTYRK